MYEIFGTYYEVGIHLEERKKTQQQISSKNMIKVHRDIEFEKER